MTDIPAATKLFATWPTDIYISGFEVGEAILYPAVSIENDFPRTILLLRHIVFTQRCRTIAPPGT